MCSFEWRELQIGARLSIKLSQPPTRHSDYCQSVQGAILPFRAGQAPHVRGDIAANVWLHFCVRLAVTMISAEIKN